MIGDNSDVLARLRMMLPARWFADSAPVLDAVLLGLANGWSGIYALLQNVRMLTRIMTAGGVFLDIAAVDYFGNTLPRRAGEPDQAYSTRIHANLLAPRATRSGVVTALLNLTGRQPIIFEPLNPADTGGYNVNLGYNVAGGYGCNSLPFQFFVTAYRPNATPVSHAGGYNSGPGGFNRAPMFYADPADLSGNIPDAEIYATIAGVLPAATIAWTTISN